MTRFLANNERPGTKEIKLRCRECGTIWTPYGKGGVVSCSKCGELTYGDRGSRGLKRIA